MFSDVKHLKGKSGPPIDSFAGELEAFHGMSLNLIGFNWNTLDSKLLWVDSWCGECSGFNGLGPFFIKFGEDSVTCFSSAKPKPTPIIVSRSDSEVETEIDSEIEKKFEFSLNSIVSDTLMNNIKNCEKLKAQ